MHNLLPHLTPRWHTYALDQRGHGRSGRVANQYHLVDYTRDVVAFIEHLPEPAVVIGHSLGADVALATAASCPEWTRAAVLIDPPLYFRELGIEATPEIKAWFDWVGETVRQSTTQEMIVARCREKAPEASESEIASLADECSHVAVDSVQTILQNQLFAGFDLAAALRQVRSPLLLMYGDWSQGAVVSDEDRVYVSRLLPSAKFVKIPDGSHSFLDEQTELTMQDINALLSSV